MKNKQSQNVHTNAFIVIGVIFVSALVCLIIGENDGRSADEIINFQLKGNDILYLYVDEVYSEPGFIAEGGVSGNVNSYVTVTENVNTKYPGIYDVIYKLNYNGVVLEKNRKVKVINKPLVTEEVENELEEVENTISGKNDGLKVATTDKIKIKLKGHSHIYILKGISYSDEGVLAVTNSGKDVTASVVKDGSVDTDTVGTYTLTYTVTDDSGNSASLKRIVDVMDMSINATVNTNDNTNKSVILKVTVTADEFSYIIMPNGVKNKSNTGEYIVQNNGKYSFKVVNKQGLSTIYTYTIDNIDKTVPNGSCSGYTTGQESFISVKSSDNLGVSKYMIGNNSYTSNYIHLNEVVPKPSIVIYDVAGNAKTISCELENR